MRFDSLLAAQFRPLVRPLTKASTPLLRRRALQFMGAAVAAQADNPAARLAAAASGTATQMQGDSRPGTPAAGTRDELARTQTMAHGLDVFATLVSTTMRVSVAGAA